MNIKDAYIHNGIGVLKDIQVTAAGMLQKKLAAKDTTNDTYLDWENVFNLTNIVPSSVPWSALTGTPTTLAGYGITDAAGSGHTHTWIGDSSLKLYAGDNNEINFGGSANGYNKIFFGYRVTDNRSIPTQFVFGGSTGTASITANAFIKKDGTSDQFLKADGSLDGNSYALSTHNHFLNNIVPIAEKQYDAYTIAASNTNKGWLYFINVIPTSDNYYAPWSIKYKLYVTTTENATQGVYYCYVSTTGTTINYAVFNDFYSGSYRPIYNHVVAFHNNAAKYANKDTYPIKIGVRVQSARSDTTLARVFKVEVYEAIGCTFTINDSIQTYDSFYNANYYGYNTEISAISTGLQETGDANDTAEARNIGLYYTRLTAGTNGMQPYSLIMRDGNDTWQSFVLYGNSAATQNTGTSKAKNPVGFKLGSRVYYLAKSTRIASGAQNANNEIKAYINVVDLRYSLNITSSNTASHGAVGLTRYKPVYIVGTINSSDGLFYLDDHWWTQDEPTTEDNKIYIRITNSVYPDNANNPNGQYRADLISDGYAFYFKDGRFQRYTQTSDSANYAKSAGSVSWNNVTDKPDSYPVATHNHDDLYLKLTGGTMTGTIDRQYDAASDSPVLKIGSNNKDIQIFKVYSNDATYSDTGSLYGYALKYIGSGTGISNFLRLIADNATGTKVTAVSINQSGQVGILADPNTSYALYVNGNTNINGSVTATSLIKSGGTSAQFLKADGSVDSNTYSLSTHSHDSTYVTLTTAQTITGAKVFKGSTSQTENDTVRMPLKLGLSTYSDSGHNVAAIGFSNEQQTTPWYKGFIGYERTGSYDTGKFVIGLNNTAAAGSATYDDIVVTIDAAGNVTATTFTGNLSGNATSATTAATAESVDWANITNKPATATGYGYIGTTAVQASSATQDVTGIGTITLTKIHTTNYEVAEGTNNRLCVGSYNQSTAKGLNVGDLLVSSAWADSTKVPTNGIYAKGIIKSGASVEAATYIRAVGGNVYVGSATNSQCHLQYDDTNKCLKFIFD